mmetsp:Transcript_29630/g.85235  ORF Transcript_29630/g.85235 Transcript_29630/m.85235 type:complete len:170 (-) Transcript_29630:1618-2127(-)
MHLDAVKLCPHSCAITLLKYAPWLDISSLCDPRSMTTPPQRKKMTSEFRTVESRWAIAIVVKLRLACCNWSIVVCTCSSDSLSSAEVASSKSKTCGRLAMARAIAMRCFCPPEKWQPCEPTKVSKPFGNALMTAPSCACSAASKTCKSDINWSPPWMLARSEAAKSTGS